MLESSASTLRARRARSGVTRLVALGALLCLAGCGAQEAKDPAGAAPTDALAPRSSSPAPSLVAVRPVLQAIAELESERDPKCHATASRLEDFMFGTPLSDEARWLKNARLSALSLEVWRRASAAQRQRGGDEVEAAQISEAFAPLIQVALEAGTAIDLRQYGSVAFSLRATLAAWQRSQALDGGPLLPLSSAALRALQSKLDRVALAILSHADKAAREGNEVELTRERLMQAWAEVVAPHPGDATEDKAPPGPSPLLTLARAITEGKVASYAAYNEVSNQLFFRNIQVHFARRAWPSEPEEKGRLKGALTESLIAFAGDLYVASQGMSQGRGGGLITEADVHAATQAMAPFSVDIQEDVTFFSRLDDAEQVWLEAYDLDAFRDSGLHWRYLAFAFDAPNFKPALDIDPFALELLTESVAQMGVLMLRLAGEGARARGSERLATADLAAAVKTIAERTVAHHRREDSPRPEIALASAPGAAEKGGAQAWFKEVSAELGLTMRHRSADWLNRLLRSYLDRGEGRGEITIPPAFGGSGLASGDVDGDGWEDLLVLSGGGNRLYRNLKGQGFEDITERAQIGWRRSEDRQPGEPRQALIADLNNDGHQDIIITYVDDDHRLYRGLGDGRFEDLSAQAALGGKGLVGGPALLADFNGDGLLDLYIAYFGHYTRGVLPSLARRNTNGLPNMLFQNLGDFRFREVAEEAGVADSGWGQALMHTDLDSDGHQDLIVGNDFGVNRYYRNLEGRGFKDVTEALRTGKPSYTMGFGIADLNQDLRPDVYVSNIVVMNKDEKYVSPNASTQMKFDPEKLANMRVVEANDLFLSDGGAYTQSKRVDRGYADTGWSWGADFVDVDLDGDEDLYVLNGMNDFRVYGQDNPYYTNPSGQAQAQVQFAPAERDTNVFFINEGGRLNLFNAPTGLGLKGNSRSALWFDYDRDGDLDVVIHGYHEPLTLMRNDAPRADGHWLMLKLSGDPKQGSSRDAIGAKVIVGLPDKRLLWREVRSAGGYLCGNSKFIHLGLGAHTEVALTVIWPGGKRQQAVIDKVDTYALINQAAP